MVPEIVTGDVLPVRSVHKMSKFCVKILEKRRKISLPKIVSQEQDHLFLRLQRYRKQIDPK